MHLIEASANSENERIVNDGQAVEPETPVAAAKVHVPAVPSTVLLRERLHALLDTAIAATDIGPPVTVVRAPAGAGKTAMLATWARRQIDRGACVAWVSLDGEDNDPVLLWAAIVRALRMSGAWESEPFVPSQRTAFPVAVIAAFERLAKPAVLILDGVQDVQSADSVRTLNNLLRHLPATMRVVLATRFPPPLILPRLKLEGRLHEIGPDHLTFTVEEARELFANEGIELTESQLDALMERTEGWAAGLRLAAITFADPTEPDELITGDDGMVADYLIGEVVARQPEDVQRFMLSTCVCATFTSGLAAALSRQENAGQILDRLERTSILAGKRHQGRRWYRYHPLLRSYLLAELGRRQPSTQQQLQHTAATWFLASGDPLRAMGHGIAAEDDDLVTRLIAKFGLEQIARGETERLRRILDTTPAHVLARPSVALVATATALDLDDLLSADRMLRRLENSAHPLRSQRLRALHATLRLQRARPHGDLRAGVADRKSVV